MSTSCFLRTLSTTMEAVMVTCRAACSAGATDTYEFRRCNGFCRALFKVPPVEINTFVTNSHTARPGGEVIDLILTFPTKRTLRGGALLLLIISPHRYPPFLLMPSGVAVILTCVDVAR